MSVCGEGCLEAERCTERERRGGSQGRSDGEEAAARTRSSLRRMMSGMPDPNAVGHFCDGLDCLSFIHLHGRHQRRHFTSPCCHNAGKNSSLSAAVCASSKWASVTGPSGARENLLLLMMLWYSESEILYCL